MKRFVKANTRRQSPEARFPVPAVAPVGRIVVDPVQVLGDPRVDAREAPPRTAPPPRDQSDQILLPARRLPM